MTFSLPYVFDYVTNLSRQQAEATQNHENNHVRSVGQGGARQKEI
jgi:hypothetical protein